MEEKLIPDYSKYDIDLLVDAYTHLDRVSRPLESKILDDELKKRFNLEPETEINPKVVMGFINILKVKNKKEYVDIEDIGPSEPLTPIEKQAISDFIKQRNLEISTKGVPPEKNSEKRQKVPA